MSEKPILMTPANIVAIDEGRKTMTRRLLKPQPCDFKPLGPRGSSIPYKQIADELPGVPTFAPIEPRYAVGDKLWIKEKWRINSVGCVCPEHGNKPHIIEVEYGMLPGEGRGGDSLFCGADIQIQQAKAYYRKHKDDRYSSARFMFKWAARKWLLVTEVDAPQQGHSLSINQIRAEGVRDTRNLKGEIVETYFEKWVMLLTSIYGPDAMEKWYWPYTFKKIEKE
ncbi:MAG: hypothetical protein V3W44_04155 [Dehalococcoidales bacterium]